MSAASARRARRLPRAGPDQRHRVEAVHAGARPGRGGLAGRGGQPGVGEDVGDDAVLAGVLRQPGRLPRLPGRARNSTSAASWTVSSASSGCVARGQLRVAGGARARRGSRPCAPGPRWRACARRPRSPRADRAAPPPRSRRRGSRVHGRDPTEYGPAAVSGPLPSAARGCATSASGSAGWSPGRTDAITDVPGVRVGHVTVWRDAPQVARTGVTAIVPATTSWARRCAAGAAVLNGAGEMTGFVTASEWRMIETPVYLTSTMAVGRIYDGAVSVAIESDPVVADEVVIPVVGECDDSWLSTAAPVQVEAADAGRAVAAAAGGAGRRGRGGRRHRAWSASAGRAGSAPRSRRVGEHVSARSCSPTSAPRPTCASTASRSAARCPTRRSAPPPAGSCIAVLATDLPLDGAQLERLARRAGLGLARTGSVAHHGSGEIFLAFSVAGRRPRGLGRDGARAPRGGAQRRLHRGGRGDGGGGAQLPVGGTGRDRPRGRSTRGLPHEPVLELLRARGRTWGPDPRSSVQGRSSGRADRPIRSNLS